MSGEWTEIDGVMLMRSTPGAGHFRFDDGDEEWIPWSLIDHGSVDKDGETGTLVLKTWKARQIGFDV